MTGEAAPARGRRIAVLLEYDGTAYRGSQYQVNGPSIQSELEAAINNLTSEQLRVAFAGRTDAGVHALGQVAAFDTAAMLSPDEFVRGLNRFLPPDIAVKVARVVAPAFDPRRDATGRRYRYRIVGGRGRPALDRERAWHVPRPLDIDAMVRAARAVAGKHDFAAFAAPFEGETKRTLRQCQVGRCGGGVTVEMEAQAFLPHQVRRTVGPLVEVGLGRMTVEAIEDLLREAKPSTAGPAAPPHGLYLVEVKYEGLVFEPENGNGQDA